MDVHWGERLDNSGDSDSDHIENIWVLFEEHIDVAVTRAKTLNGECLIVLVKRHLDHFRVGKVNANADSAYLFCKHVCMLILQVNR